MIAASHGGSSPVPERRGGAVLMPGKVTCGVRMFSTSMDATYLFHTVARYSNICAYLAERTSQFRALSAYFLAFTP